VPPLLSLATQAGLAASVELVIAALANSNKDTGSRLRCTPGGDDARAPRREGLIARSHRGVRQPGDRFGRSTSPTARVQSPMPAIDLATSQALLKELARGGGEVAGASLARRSELLLWHSRV